MFCTVWKVETMDLLNIIYMEGKCSASIQDHGKAVLLRKAIEIIEKAQKFNGRLIEPNNTSKCEKNSILVMFEIVFPTRNELDNFLKELPKK